MYNEGMKKKKVEGRKDDRMGLTLMICMSLIVVSLIGLFIYASTREYAIFKKTFVREMGSDSVKVLRDGSVYCDSETEEPNHKEKWQFVMKLDEKQMEEFLGRTSYSSDEEIREYIRDNIGCIQEIYR